MRRWYRRLWRFAVSFIYWTITGVLFLLILLVLALQLPWVQRGAASGVERFLDLRFGVRVSLERVSLSLPLRATLHHAVVYDLHGDTLIAAGELSTSLRGLTLSGPSVSLGSTRWVDGYMRMHTDSLGQQRLKEFLACFKSKKPKLRKSSFQLSISDIELRNVRYILSRDGAKRIPSRVDFRHLDLSGVYGHVRHLRVSPDSVRLSVEGLECLERSGVQLDGVSCRLSINPSQIYLNDLHLRHGFSSLHVPRLRFGLAGWESLSDFVNRVEIDAHVQPSVLHTETLRHFAPLPVGEGFPLVVSARVRGHVSDLRVSDLDFSAGDSTRLLLNASFQGLPDIHSTVVNIHFERFSTTMPDVEQLVSGFSGRGVRLPKALSGVGFMQYMGNLTGFLDNFVAYGNLHTDLGRLRLDMGLEYDTLRNVQFKGEVHTQGLDLRSLMRDTLWGSFTGHARVDGSVRPDGAFKTELFARVDSVSINGHNYRNAQFNGLASNRSFEGAFSVRDTALQVRFEGVIDLEDNTLPYFRFGTRIDRADLHAMGLNREDSLSVLSATVDVNFQGSRLDDLDGSLMVEDVSYTNSRGTLRLGNTRLEASQDGGVRKLLLVSPLARAFLETSNRYDALLPSLKEQVYRHLPALSRDSGDLVSLSEGRFDYRAEFSLDSVVPLFRVLYPSLYLAPRTEGRIVHVGDGGLARLHFSSDSLSYGSFSASDVLLRGELGDSANMGELFADRFWWSGRRIHESQLSFHVKDGGYRVAFRLADGRLDTAHNALFLRTVGVVERDLATGRPFTVLRLDSSRLLLNGRGWVFSRARIRLDLEEVSVSNFHLTNRQQRLSMSGRLSRNPSDTLVLQLGGIDLSQFGSLLPQPSLRGTLRGYARLMHPFDGLGVKLGFDIEDFRVNDIYVGHFRSTASWLGRDKPVLLEASNTSLEGVEDIRVDVEWVPATKRHRANVSFNGFDLSSLHILARGKAQPLGRIAGSLVSSGSLTNPTIRGALHFDQAGAYVPDLNSTFLTSSTVRFEGGSLSLDRFRIHDAMGGSVTVDGRIDYSHPKSPQLDLRLSGNEFHLSNTNSFGKQLFYGHLATSLQAEVAGRLDNMSLNVQMRTLPSSNITVQLPSSAEARRNAHLLFTSTLDSIRRDTASRRVSPSVASNLRLNMSLHLTNEAQVQLVLNPRTGDMIRARGEANLRIATDPLRNTLLMYGDYTLQRGEMQFTLEGLMSKRFRIAQGSTIRFAGDAMQAYADIETIYSTRASLDRLIGASEQEKYKRRIPVDCKLYLRGPLVEPKLSFAIDVPQADAETRSQLTAALNTEEKKMRQFASLLLINSFISDSRLQSQVEGNAEAKGTAGVTGQEVILSSFGELVSNQFNSWLGQIGQSPNTPLINLGFNYRPSAYDAELDEAEVSFSMQWKSFNVDANWEVNRHNTSNAIAGDINITKQSTLLDNLQYKAFARSNDDLIFRDLKPYTAGVGVVYSDTFNDWRGFVAKLKALFRRKRSVEPEVEEGD